MPEGRDASIHSVPNRGKEVAPGLQGLARDRQAPSEAHPAICYVPVDTVRAGKMSRRGQWRSFRDLLQGRSGCDRESVSRLALSLALLHFRLTSAWQAHHDIHV